MSPRFEENMTVLISCDAREHPQTEELLIKQGFRQNEQTFSGDADYFTESAELCRYAKGGLAVILTGENPVNLAQRLDPTLIILAADEMNNRRNLREFTLPGSKAQVFIPQRTDAPGKKDSLLASALQSIGVAAAVPA